MSHLVLDDKIVDKTKGPFEGTIVLFLVLLLVLKHLLKNLVSLSLRLKVMLFSYFLLKCMIVENIVYIVQI